MDTTTEKIILEKLDKLDGSFENLKTLIDEEHKKNAVYRYKTDELEKKMSGNGLFWRSVAIVAIASIITVTVNYFTGNVKTAIPDNSKYLEKLDKTLEKINDNLNQKK